jgi:hypothetical protein
MKVIEFDFGDAVGLAWAWDPLYAALSMAVPFVQAWTGEWSFSL